MRTDEEIIARIDSLTNNDFLGFETGDLIVCLPFDLAKRYLRPEAIEANWKVSPHDRDSVLAEMLDYMPFAWERQTTNAALVQVVAWVIIRRGFGLLAMILAT